MFFFAAAPRGRSLTHCGQPGWCFFLLWPRPDAHSLTVGWGDFGKARVVFFFFCRPRRVDNSKKCLGYGSKKTGPLLPLPFPGAGAKKKTPWVVFFFFALAPCRLPTGLLLPLPFAGAAAKKHPGVFFFCCGPARTLTHSLRNWVAMPPPRRGGVFFFAAAPPGPGWCFFFFAVAPPGRSLTHGGLGRFRQGPGGVFFLLRPRRVFLENSKKCLGYYIGSKKTRRGHSKKKNTTSKSASKRIPLDSLFVNER